MAKKKTTKTDFSEIDMHLRVLRELVDRGWAELRAKAEAEGTPLPVDPRRV